MSDDLPIRKRLWHDVPHWVEDGAWFFITVNCADRTREQLTLPAIDTPLLDAARFYHDQGKWHIGLMLLMPDHWHAIMGFPRGKPMDDLFRAWKRYTSRTLGIVWQDGFFDHRLRNDDQVTEKFRYIERNPVVKGLCEKVEDWPHQISPSADGWITGGGLRRWTYPQRTQERSSQALP